jgi:hypothetical protein
VDIKIDIDTSSVVRLTEEVLRQLPYAANNAITRTAQEAVAAAQANAAAHLEIRKNFLLRRIRILHYSRVANLTAAIGVDENVQGSPLILGFLEEGQSGEKKGSTGGGLAVPLTGSPARPSFPSKVTPKLLYKKLDMQKHTTSGGAIQWKGKQRTFAIPGVGIFERVGRRKPRSRRGRGASSQSTTVMIYRFKPSAHLGPHVELRAAMLRVISERFAPIFTAEFEKEIRARAAHLAAR